MGEWFSVLSWLVKAGGAPYKTQTACSSHHHFLVMMHEDDVQYNCLLSVPITSPKSERESVSNNTAE